MVIRKVVYKIIAFGFLLVVSWGCKTPQNTMRTESKKMPDSYNGSHDSTVLSKQSWKQYFSDQNLITLIDTALNRNQELNIRLQEIEISRNEIRARKGEYLPFVRLQASADLEKEARFTRSGAVDENLDIKPGTRFPDPFSNYTVGVFASWEMDVWKKLRNAKKAAALRYLSSVQGRNYMVTQLIAEIATSYYELMSLDNLLAIVQQNIEIQTDGLRIVRQQKDAAKLTQLAVNRFEAQLLHTTNLQYDIQQRIVEAENHIHFLTGGFPKAIPRNSAMFNDILIDSAHVGVPSQLLVNRPDIKQAELQLAAAKIDVKVARANFYPSFMITGGVGFQAFKPSYIIKPESILYNLAGDLVAPLINRNAIKAAYRNANARQVQEVYDYERTILNAYVDVVNQLAKVKNMSKSFQTKSQEVDILVKSIVVSNNLFKSARADYLEVLLTQREALESKMDLIEIKMNLLNSKVGIYKALGGGWN